VPRRTTIGDLRDLVRIESPVKAQDSHGQSKVTDWQAVCQVWAAIRPAPVGEVWQAGQPRPQTADELVIRYRDDVYAAGPKVRAVLVTKGNRVVNVDGLRIEGTGDEWLVLTTRGSGKVTA